MAGLTQPLEFRKYITCMPRPGLDTVPFLDAFLIALFVALNASAFVLAPGTSVQLPQSSTMESIETAPTAVLTVDRNELYFFEGQKLARLSVASQLRKYVDSLDAAGAGAAPVLLLKADSSITSATLFNLMDIARQAGFSRIHLAAEPETSPAAGLEGVSLEAVP